MKKTLKLTVLLFVFIAAMFAFIGVNGFVNKTNADEEVFQMVNTASIRLNGNGLRFKVKMSSTVKDDINFEDTNLYFIIMPEKYLSKVNGDYQMAITRTETGEFDSAKSHCIYVKVNDNIYSGGDGYYYANGGISNVKSANLKEKFVAIACIETNTSGEYSYRYADLPEGKTTYPATHLYNIVNKAMLYSEDDYYDEIVEQYDWYGEENYPVVVDTQAQYNEIASKANGGCDFTSFNIDVMTDLEFTDNGTSPMTTLDADVDLNGHTISYTSATENSKSLIGTLNGSINNGKINVYWTNGYYCNNSVVVIGAGSGDINNVEFDITFYGETNKNSALYAFANTLNFDSVVINARNGYANDNAIGLFYYGNNTPTTVFKNTIIISSISFGSYGMWGVGATSFAADANATNSGFFASTGAVTGIDTTAFDANLWEFNPATGVPVMAEVEEISSLAGISGVSGKYYRLTKDLNLTDSGAAQVASLDSILDLNGHTISYTSATGNSKSLIGTLNGSINNGKIVVYWTHGEYSNNSVVVIGAGSGVIKNVEFDITFYGATNGNSALYAFANTLNFDSVVINARNGYREDNAIGLFFYGNETPATVFKNTIIISSISFGSYGVWGVPATSIASDANATNSGFFTSEGTVSGIDFTVFDANLWEFNPATGVPVMAEVEEISSLAGISGVSGKYYKLTQDLNLTDSGAAQVASLDSILDLNGHTITYTSASSVIHPLIGTLNGYIANGKIVASSTLNGQYTASGMLVMGGSGYVKNVEFDISFTGWIGYNIGWVLAFDKTLTFDTCVIKATNSVNSNQVGLFVYDAGAPTTVFKNTIIISSIAFGAYGSWGISATSIASDANATNSGFFASEGTVSGIDFTVFDANLWEFNPATGVPVMAKVEEISSLAGISGVSGKYYKLTQDLNLTDSGAAYVASLDSILDLNGHTITYTSASSVIHPLIGALNGYMVNGKIIVYSTLNGQYTSGGVYVAESGSGYIKNVEFDISFTGYLDTQVVRAFGIGVTFDSCVIKATNSTTDPRVGLFYYGFDTPATVFKNTIIISTMPFGSYGIWGVGATSMAADSNVTNSGHFASAGAVTGIDLTAFDTNVWEIDSVTGLPTIK